MTSEVALVADWELQEALRQFGVPGAAHLAKMPSFSYRVVRVASGTVTAYLKRYPATMLTRVEQILGLIHHLRGESVPVPVFRKDCRGAKFCVVGDSLFTLSYSVGEKRLRPSESRKPSKFASCLLARLHKALRTVNLQSSPPPSAPSMWASTDLPDRVLRLQGQIASYRGELGRRLSAAIELVGKMLRVVPALHAIDTPRGLVHGDFWYGNIVGAANPTRGWGVVDFDEVHFGPLLLDVAQFVDLAFTVVEAGKKTGFDLQYASAFARKYAAEANIDRSLLRELPTVLLAARLCSVCWLLERRITERDDSADALLKNDLGTIHFLRSQGKQWQDQLTA